MNITASASDATVTPPETPPEAVPVPVVGDLDGTSGPRHFPAVTKDAIRQVFEVGHYPYPRLLGRIPYEAQKAALQAELLKLQIWTQETGQKFVLLFEGRDAAGKGGTIKRFMEHLNPRYARTVALSKPSDAEKGQWYFQRYVQHLPTAGEIVLFDRSWYNRAGVERVMGFCSPSEYLEFMREVPDLERMLALLHKWGDRQASPIPGQTYPTTFVTGMPSAV